jgi:hypothetical protein
LNGATQLIADVILSIDFAMASTVAALDQRPPGNDLTVTGMPDGPIPADTPVTLTVESSKAMVAGETYFGEVLLGPPTAPTALKVPITIRRL